MSSATSTNYLTSLGLGYSIAIALGFLVLLSTILLASFICCRATRNRSRNSNSNSSSSNNGYSNSTADGIILPRIIFVAEDDEEQERDLESAAVGLDQAVINSYPKFQFRRDDGFSERTDDSNNTCSIYAWLKLNGSCPVCRNSPLPTPLSTPLSEVVPLSQYAADRRRRW
ncbi:hypothetical protein OIU78_011458 [Salix suchowensis]|nr:hypothetical protein OIU78_011458 [Salix suchowensis]